MVFIARNTTQFNMVTAASRRILLCFHFAFFYNPAHIIFRILLLHFCLCSHTRMLFFMCFFAQYFLRVRVVLAPVFFYSARTFDSDFTFTKSPSLFYKSLSFYFSLYHVTITFFLLPRSCFISTLTSQLSELGVGEASVSR